MTNAQNTARQEWLDFLQRQGARINNGRVTGFSQNETQVPSTETTLLYDLSSHGIIKACGEEAQAFLQNQFCNDVHTMTETASQLNGYCTPKGRLLAFFRLWQQDNCYYMRLPRERLAATLKRLQMFVLMSKVTLSDASDELISIGVSGTEVEALLRDYFEADNTLPAQVDETLHARNITLIRAPGSVARFEITGPADAVQSLWQYLASNAVPASEEHWYWQDIQAGIPQIVDATAEAFVPQMVNLELINALSFKKGCYPGQEIVARTHYLGKQKRRMYLAHVDLQDLPAPGDTIVDGNDSSGQSVGTVVSAAPAPDGGSDLLAVLQIKQAQSGELALSSAPNSLLTLKDLPYSVEEEESGK